ncbi:subtilisin-like protease [Xylaria sp. CBS 124048]|nr:subtilisin-like protease [Xylaria sp. CBS 124048]
MAPRHVYLTHSRFLREEGRLTVVWKSKIHGLLRSKLHMNVSRVDSMKVIFLVVAVLVAAVRAAAPLYRKDDSNGIADHYIVAMKKGLPASTIQSHFDSIRAKTLKMATGKKGFVRSYEIGEFHAYHIECDEATLRVIRDSELIDYVSSDGLLRMQTPVSPMLDPVGQLIPQTHDMSWGLGRISHRLANVTKYTSVGLLPGSQPSIAYVLDSGIRTTHHEFGSRASWGKTFIEDCLDDDEDGHGTHVAGIIMGDTTGVDNTTLGIAIKVINQGQGPISAMVAGLEWAVQHAQNNSHIDRSVINISIGSDYCQMFNDAVKATVDAGMTVVVAAGNGGIDACTQSPASEPSAITVGAIDSLDNRVCNYGSCVDIFAPGINILSTFNGDNMDYAILSGTSMASPHVTGLAAYLIARKNLTTPGDVWECIKELATPDQVQNATEGTPNLIAFNGGPTELNE